MMFGKNLEIGDLVWAKMKTFPHWPAKIVPPSQTKCPSAMKSGHYVYFFGSENYAWISEENIMPHSEDMIRSSKKKRSSLLLQNAIDTIVKAALEGKSGSGKSTNGDLYAKPIASKPGKKARKAKMKNAETRKRRLSHANEESDSSGVSHVPKVQKLDVSSSFIPTATDGLRNAVIVPSDDDASIAGSTSSDNPSNPLLETDSTSTDLDEPASKKIGFLGLGKMGRAIVTNLLKTNHQVFIWNRTSCVCDAFIKDGAVKCEFPKDVVAAADIILCCVSDCEAVKDVVFGVCGVLHGLKASREEKGYVEMSSIDAETSQEIAEAIKTEGGKYLEAPVVGTRQLAEDGHLTVLGAGDRSLFIECETCFHAISKNAFFMTCDVGQCSKINLILSTLSGTLCGAMAEALALAKSICVSQKELLEVIEKSGLTAAMIKQKGKAILDQDFSAETPLKHQQKDINLALCMSDNVRQPMPVTASANELYKHTKLLGLSDLDLAAVYLGAKF